MGADSLTVRLLGAPEILRSGEKVRVDTRKAIALIAYLVVGGSSVTRDRLCGVFWPESGQSKARSALRRTLSTVRSAVGADAVLADRESVGLSTAALDIDVIDFIQAATAEDASHLERAAGLYRGSLLDGFSIRGSPEFEDWHRGEAERLRRSAESVLARLTEVVAAGGSHDKAIAYAERRIELDPLSEPAHRAAMLAEAWAGRRSRAIERYREAVRILDDELGVSPLPETTALYEAIRRGEAPDPPRDDEPEPPALTRDGIRREAPQLVGRDDEIAALVAAYHSAAYDGGVVAVLGEAGIGRTSLLTALAEVCLREGAAVAVAHCHGEERDLPYAAIAQVLHAMAPDPAAVADLPEQVRSAVAGLMPTVPGSAGAVPATGEGAEARIRFFESLRIALRELSRSEKPTVVAFDDFHLIDDASAEFVGYLMRRLSGTRLLAVLSIQPDALPSAGPVRQVADAAGEWRVVELARMNQSALIDIVRSIDGELDPASLAAIARRADGIPLFAAEMARSGATADHLPGRVRSVLDDRLSRAGDVATQLIEGAAVLGRAFSEPLIRAITARTDEETAGALDALVELGIFSEVAGVGFDFAHATLRRAAYERVPPGRRRLLHRRVAEALAATARATAAQLGEAARHAESAGEPERAALIYADAGRAARLVHANTEAERYYTSALTLGAPDAPHLRAALGDLATLAGRYRRAVREYEAAAASLSGAERGRIEHKLGRLYGRRGDWEAARSFLNAGLTLVDDAERSDVYADLATNAFRRGDDAASRDLAGRALAEAEALQDAGAQARAANVAGLLARAAGDIDAASSQLEHAARRAAVAGDGEMAVAALNNLALTAADRGQPEESRDLLEQALALCRDLGDRHREAALLSNLGDAYFALGDTEEAAESVKASAGILAEIGFESEELIPEVWSLREW